MHVLLQRYCITTFSETFCSVSEIIVLTNSEFSYCSQQTIFIGLFNFDINVSHLPKYEKQFIHIQFLDLIILRRVLLFFHFFIKAHFWPTKNFSLVKLVISYLPFALLPFLHIGLEMGCISSMSHNSFKICMISCSGE